MKALLLMIKKLLSLLTAGTGNSGSSGPSLEELPSELRQKLKESPGDREMLEEVLRLPNMDEKSASMVFRALANEDPRHTRNLARLHMLGDKPSLAVIQYKKCLREEPQRGLYLELAEVYESMGKSDLADEARNAGDRITT